MHSEHVRKAFRRCYGQRAEPPYRFRGQSNRKRAIRTRSGERRRAAIAAGRARARRGVGLGVGPAGPADERSFSEHGRRWRDESCGLRLRGRTGCRARIRSWPDARMPDAAPATRTRSRRRVQTVCRRPNRKSETALRICGAETLEQFPSRGSSLALAKYPPPASKAGVGPKIGSKLRPTAPQITGDTKPPQFPGAVPTSGGFR